MRVCVFDPAPPLLPPACSFERAANGLSRREYILGLVAIGEFFSWLGGVKPPLVLSPLHRIWAGQAQARARPGRDRWL